MDAPETVFESVIESKAIEMGGLDSLRKLLNDRRQHKLYKAVFEVEVGQENEKFWELTEEDICEEMMTEQAHYKNEEIDGNVTMDEKDFIVEKRELHYGRNEDNPVAQMRFMVNKAERILLQNPINKLPLCGEVPAVAMNTPLSFVKRTIRFFSRTPTKHELVGHICASWYEHRDQRIQNPNSDFKDAIHTEVEDDEEESQTQQSSQEKFLTQDVDPPSVSSTRKRSDSDESLPNSHPPSAKKRLSYD